jgi:hypothetical protein
MINKTGGQTSEGQHWLKYLQRKVNYKSGFIVKLSISVSALCAIPTVLHPVSIESLGSNPSEVIYTRFSVLSCLGFHLEDVDAISQRY